MSNFINFHLKISLGYAFMMSVSVLGVVIANYNFTIKLRSNPRFVARPLWDIVVIQYVLVLGGSIINIEHRLLLCNITLLCI